MSPLKGPFLAVKWRILRCLPVRNFGSRLDRVRLFWSVKLVRSHVPVRAVCGSDNSRGIPLNHQLEVNPPRLRLLTRYTTLASALLVPLDEGKQDVYCLTSLVRRYVLMGGRVTQGSWIRHSPLRANCVQRGTSRTLPRWDHKVPLRKR